MQPRVLVRLEGVAIAAAGFLAYYSMGFDLLLLVPLVLWPDVSIAAYLAGPRVGSAVYNVVHFLALPLALLAASLWVGHSLGTAAGLAWLAHVGVDRAAGFGLKYADADFADTHVQRV